MLNKLFQNRIWRFLICGGISAVFNIVLLAIIIETWQIKNPINRNIANIVSIEISLIFSFFLYRIWVWSMDTWNFRKILWREIPIYQLSCGSVVAIRGFILFPLLDWLGINYSINTLIGIIIGSVLNFVMNEKLVFKNNK